MAAAAIVAITASRIAADRMTNARWPACATNETYIAALRSVGLRPVLLPVTEDGAEVAGLVESFGGVVLPGGGDVDPARYGAERHPKTYGIDAERDAFEAALIAGARRLRLPMLAICRGIQVWNVACGGDLVQHVPDLPDAAVHGARVSEPAPAHPVTVVPGSRLASAVGVSEIPSTTSLHHQAVGRVGAGLEVTARSPDGLVEAVEPPAADPWWAVGVQWHPEVTALDDPLQRRLFSAFAAAVFARSGR